MDKDTYEILKPIKPGTKQCSKCSQFKPLADFSGDSKAKDGLCRACKDCSNIVYKARVAKNALEREANPPSMEGTKRCQSCGEEKLKNEFSKSLASKDGFYPVCKVCDKVRCKQTAAKNREKYALNQLSMDGNKFCRQCGEFKPKTDFFLNRSAKDGLHHNCKSCKRKIDKARHIVNAYNRTLNPPISDKLKKCTICEIEKPLSEFFKSETNKDGKAFRCKSCAAQFDKKYRDDYPQKRWAISTIGQHRKRGFETIITSDELATMAMAAKRCPICECSLDWGRKEGGHIYPNSPTLDRKNNEKRIAVESTMILCHRCNSAKHDFTIPDLIKWCENVKRWVEEGSPNYKT